jgi:hypothetical protein
MNLRYEVCSDETHSWIVLDGGIGTLKTIPIGTEAGIPLTHLPVDPSIKNFPRQLLPEPLHHYGLQVFIQHKFMGDRNTK